MAENDRALIIGAGPGGLAAAVALQRAGIETAVFEQADELKEIGAALGVQTNVGKALRQIGVELDAPSVNPTEWQEFRTASGKLLSRSPMGQVARKFGMPVVNVLRQDLQFALLAALDRSALNVASKCVGVTQDDAGVTATFADGREERGAMLVGADGLRSVVRRDTLADGDPRYSGFASWRAVVQVDRPPIPLETIRQCIGKGSIFSIFPLGGDRVYWGGMGLAPVGEPDPPKGRKQEVLDRFSAYEDTVTGLVEATPEASFLHSDIYDRDPVPSWGTGRITLLGDAAHVTTPFMGQGAGIAMEDGVALAKELTKVGWPADKDGISRALKAYEAKRTARTAAIVLASRKFGRLYQFRDPIRSRFRDLMISRTSEDTWRKRLEESLGYEV